MENRFDTAFDVQVFDGDCIRGMFGDILIEDLSGAARSEWYQIVHAVMDVPG